MFPRCSFLFVWIFACLVASPVWAAPPEDEWAEEGEWVEEAPPPEGEWVEEAPPAEGEWAEEGEWVEEGAPPPPPEDEWVEEGVISADAVEDVAVLLEQQLGSNAAVKQLAADGYVLCDPSAREAELVKCIRGNLAIARDAVRTKAIAQREDRDSDRLGMIMLFVFLAGFAGLFLLGMPVYLRKRYPKDRGRLFGFSILATILFTVNMFLFAIALLTLRVTQSIGGQETSPKIAMVDASFDVLTEQAPHLVDLFPVLFEPTIVQLSGDADKDMTVLLLENIAKLQQDVAVFERFAGVFESVNSILDYSDIVFTLVAVVVFGIGFKDVFLDIIKLPIRAMEARDERAGRLIARSSLSRSLREMGVVCVMIFVILLLTAIAGATMRAAVGPAVELLLGFVVMGLFYVQLTPDASTFAIAVGLGSGALILILNVAVVLVSNVLFLAKSQRLLRARFQWKVPLRKSWRFFGFGLLIVVGVQLLPWVYLEIADVVFEATLGRLLDGDDPPLGFVLGFGGAGLLGCWLLSFWAARGIKGLRYLLRYPLPKKPEPTDGAADSHLAPS